MTELDELKDDVYRLKAYVSELEHELRKERNVKNNMAKNMLEMRRTIAAAIRTSGCLRLTRAAIEASSPKDVVTQKRVSEDEIVYVLSDPRPCEHKNWVYVVDGSAPEGSRMCDRCGAVEIAVPMEQCD